MSWFWKNCHLKLTKLFYLLWGRDSTLFLKLFDFLFGENDPHLEKDLWNTDIWEGQFQKPDFSEKRCKILFFYSDYNASVRLYF